MKSVQVNFPALESEYANPNSLSFKKIQIVNEYVPEGGKFLDIGMGTGELISLRRGKHEHIYGIDSDDTSVQICKEKFNQCKDIVVSHGDINDIDNIFHEKFDCVTCLDILEHIEERNVPQVLINIFTSLNEGGMFIFSGPGIFEKIRILLGRSPTHLHSHSSYWWRKYIENTGFTIINVQSVEFPLINKEFLRRNFHLFGKCCIIVAQKKKVC